MSVVSIDKYRKKEDDYTIDLETKDDIANELTLDMIDELFIRGYDISKDPKSMKEVLVIIEALNCLMNRLDGINHQFREISDNIIELDDKNSKKFLDYFLGK